MSRCKKWLRYRVISRISGDVSSKHGEISIVELNNVSTSESASVALKINDEAGISATNTSLGVPPLGTFHYIASTLVPLESLAASEVEGGSSYISASSLFYKLNTLGGLEYAYAAPLVMSPGTDQFSEFNSFIQHVAEFEAYNSSPQTILWNIGVLDYAGAEVCSDKGNKLDPGQSKRFQLPTPPNTYGTVLVQSDRNGLITRTYVRRPDVYTLTFRGVTSPSSLHFDQFTATTTCVATTTTTTSTTTTTAATTTTSTTSTTILPPPTDRCEQCDLRGCCSSHGGVAHCPGDGSVHCADGFVSGCKCFPL
ncbi:MAG: hypothetical protein IT291_07935 [Deltaproteobacteria bacterium]|nr:hypothetical protein [Deltaproteobacteria bacterium]